jgi:hypothetical protein
MSLGKGSASTGTTASFAAMLLVAMAAGVSRCPPEMGILGGFALPVQSILAYESLALNVLNASLADRSMLLNSADTGRYGRRRGTRPISRYSRRRRRWSPGPCRARPAPAGRRAGRGSRAAIGPWCRPGPSPRAPWCPPTGDPARGPSPCGRRRRTGRSPAAVISATTRCARRPRLYAAERPRYMVGIGQCGLAVPAPAGITKVRT